MCWMQFFLVFLAQISSEAARKIIEVQYVHFSIFTSILGEPLGLLYKEPANRFWIHHLLKRYFAVCVAAMSLSIRIKELD